jgi:NADH-quinone oxidoreductase subunit E
MLTAEQRHEIENEAACYAQKRAAGPVALKILQRDRGWVSDETLKEVAAMLEMTPDELDGVATFYNLIFRKPAGKQVILVCDGVSCWVMGYDRMLDYMTARLGIKLGETTADGLFTLLPAAGLGACDLAPVMMVDNVLYGNLTPKKIDEILARYESTEGS